MRRNIRLLLPTLLLLALGTQGGSVDRDEEWQDPLVIGRNKQPAHATLVPYATIEQALAGRRDASPFYRSLNGRWKFHYASKPADRSRDFFRVDFDDSAWRAVDDYFQSLVKLIL